MTAARRDSSSRVIPPPLRQSIRRRLLRWYDRSKRDLPWRRRAGDPYAQWVAEIMLQQTRVETVVPYYERFMRRFPTVEVLARARHETVLKHWEGMGYYRRALHLHEAARFLRREKRSVPVTAADLRGLPGIGEYTAAAIASIAFREPVAAVDGNVARVVARLRCIDADILTPAGRQQIGQAAAQLLARSRPGDFNQAWMDLGSAVCTSKSPDCETCPLQSNCVATATGRSESLPVRDGNRKKPRRVVLLAVAFQCQGAFLVRRRPKGGLWSGLWELPTMELNGELDQTKSALLTPRAALRVVESMANEYRLTITTTPISAGVVHHQLTHLSVTLHVFVVPVDRAYAFADRRQSRWVASDGPLKLSVSTVQRKAMGAAAGIAVDGDIRELEAMEPAR